MKASFSLFVLIVSFSLGQAQELGYAYPGNYQAPANPPPAVVYEAPIVYEAPVIYQAPVAYYGPVYYVAPASSYDWRSDWEQQCAGASTVVYIGNGGQASYAYEPVCNSGSTLILIGHRFHHLV